MLLFILPQRFALLQGSGALVISAAAEVGFALESAEWNNGLFTYAVLKTLKEKDGDANKNKKRAAPSQERLLLVHRERLERGFNNFYAALLNILISCWLPIGLTIKSEMSLIVFARLISIWLIDELII